MNLSPIARGVNALCHQLASAQPPAPVSLLNVDYTQALIDQHWPIPKPAPSRWISRDEAAAMFDPARDLTGEVGTFGFDWGKGDDVGGWWAKVCGRAVFWPDWVSMDMLTEVYGQAQTMGVGAVRTWFDEQDQRFRSERVEIQKDARLTTLTDFLAAATACKDLEGKPVKPMELTRAEYDRLRAVALPHLRIAGPRWRGHHTLDGVEIRVKD